MFELTKGQSELICEIVNWYSMGYSEDFVYSGPAGTGKTTVLPYIINELGLEQDEVLYVAYTGKASSVLMQKGFDASTIHSAFYDIQEKAIRDKKTGKLVLKNGRPVTKFEFVEKKCISPRIKLIVIDEWSMVSDEFAKVIYKFGIPVIASGDKYQLRPVFGECSFANRIKYNLTEITRQAEGSGIIKLATLIRNGEQLPDHYYRFGNDARILSKDYLKDKDLLKADMILTAKNKTRNTFNDKIRKLHGHTGKLPEKGDKLINRKNDWSKSLEGIPLVNGIIGICRHPIIMDECNLSRGIYRMDFQPDYVDEWTYYEALKCDYDFLNERCGEKEINLYNDGAKLEYAEAITVHLAQGSQYGDVIYWDEWVGDRDFMQQIRYTAVTRATNNVTMFI